MHQSSVKMMKGIQYSEVIASLILRLSFFVVHHGQMAPLVLPQVVQQ
jgi:hypothetical protein